MKKGLLCLTAMFLFSFSAVAQTPSTTTDKEKNEAHHHASKSASTKTMGGEKTLTGCVSQEPGENEFMLKTGMRRNVELETTEDLKPHVGHTVKVTGMWDKDADKAEAGGGADAMGHKDMAGKSESTSKEAGEHKGMREHHFKVTKLDMVSETCKMGTSKAKASTKATTKTKS